MRRVVSVSRHSQGRKARNAARAGEQRGANIAVRAKVERAGKEGRQHQKCAGRDGPKPAERGHYTKVSCTYARRERMANSEDGWGAEDSAAPAIPRSPASRMSPFRSEDNVSSWRTNAGSGWTASAHPGHRDRQMTRREAAVLGWTALVSALPELGSAFDAASRCRTLAIPTSVQFAAAHHQSFHAQDCATVWGVIV